MGRRTRRPISRALNTPPRKRERGKKRRRMPARAAESDSSHSPTADFLLAAFGEARVETFRGGCARYQPLPAIYTLVSHFLPFPFSFHKKKAYFRANLLLQRKIWCIRIAEAGRRWEGIEGWHEKNRGQFERLKDWLHATCPIYINVGQYDIDHIMCTSFIWPTYNYILPS